MLYVAQSDSLDIFENLALEDLLLETSGATDRCLFLWRADDAVVIGKNQNPWLECDLPYLDEQSIRLARRVSGGGAVFHDAGNLNYCFILPRWTYEDQCIYTLVIDALARLGIQVECSGKNGLTLGGLKVGGTAYCYRKELVMHHGTLLVAADLDKLNRSLVPRVAGIESHGIRSTPAEVTNLPCDIEVLEEALKAQFEEAFAASADAMVFPVMPTRKARHFASDAWLYGRTPRFSYDGPEGAVRVEKGMVVDAPDASWIGRPFAEVV